MSKKAKNGLDNELEEDTDFSDEQGGGGDLMTEEEFDDALFRATRKLEDIDEESERDD